MKNIAPSLNKKPIMNEKGFRYDISFLRVLAVVSVVFYHFKFPYFHGGYIGVDIFFVISGFLMTKIIFSNLSSNTFRLFDFYKKRLTRIFPALLTLISIFGLLLFFVLPIKIFDFSKDAFSSSLFYSNIYYYYHSNYFDASSQENFLLHTWSLSLEWQFYIIYPILILIWQKFLGTNKNQLFLYIITSISFLLMILIIRDNNKSFAFYMFITRAWEMTIGGLAYFIGEKMVNKKTKLINSISIISFILLVSCIINIIPIGLHGWPSKLTLLPVLATFLIIVCNPQIGVLKNGVIRFIGDISYSWYLWHWPIYVLVIFFTPDYNLFHKCLFIGVTFIISIASYYLIEKQTFFLKPIRILTYTAFIAIIFSGMPYIYKGNDPILFYKNYKTEILPKQFNIENGHLMYDTKTELLDTLEYHKKIDNQITYLLIGDSHTGMFSDYIINEAAQKNINLIQISADATFPYPNTISDYNKPQELIRWIFNTYIPKNQEKIDRVLISANYSAYDTLDLINKIKENEKYFRDKDIPLTYIGQTPKYKIDYPILEFLISQYHVNYNQYEDPKVKTTNNLLKQQNIDYLELLSSHVNKYDNENFYIYDKNHLSEFGAKQYAKIIADKLF